MSFNKDHILKWLDLGVALLVLIFILAYTFAFFFAYPYVGFEISIPRSDVSFVFASRTEDETLQVGDNILTLNGKPIIERLVNLREPLFPPVHTGEVMALKVERAGEPIDINWVIPGPSLPEIGRRLLRPWYLAYIYWAFGVLTALVVRPRDERMRMMIAYNFIGAIWIISGVNSPSHTWYGTAVLHAASWMLAWVTIHFNWIYPRPLWPVSMVPFQILFIICAAMAGAELFYLPPTFLYTIPIAVAGVGTLGLLAARFIIFPEQRRELRLLPLAIVLMLSLGITVSFIVGYSTGYTVPADLTLIFLSLLPTAYFYAVYKKHLGSLEVRLNNLIGLTVFIACLVIVSLVITLIAISWAPDEGIAMARIITSLIVGLTGALAYTPFQNWFEQRFLGVPAPKSSLLSRYSARLSGSLEYSKLYELLHSEVFPTFLIRQVALVRLQMSKGNADAWDITPALLIQVEPDQLPHPDEIQDLVKQASSARIPLALSDSIKPCPWARVVLPLVIEGQLIGLCLLGRRDPDDYYAPGEIVVLQTLMDQTALALGHIDQASRLRAFYQSDIQAQESERSRLARELHDEVLAQMTLIRQGVDESQVGEHFNQAYQAAVQNIRGMIAGLRPAALNYGLQTALLDYGDEIRESSEKKHPGINVTLDVKGDSHRYPPDVELHLYRIVQQACQNSLSHARPQSIVIVGKLEEDNIELVVQDNGIGFSSFHSSDLAELLSSQHYGLAGMYERAALIHAILTIESSPEVGTQVCVRWENAENR